MKAFNQFWDMSKKNKAFALLVLAICFGIIELTTHFFSEMPARISGEGGDEIVAIVQTVKTDVRHKPVEEEAWYKAEAQGEIVRGDAVYSGKSSHSQVRMQSGGILELGEETLVIFDDVDGVTVPDVARGKVKIKVSGQMRIAISGEVTDFTGSQSELELSAGGGQNSVRALKGKIGVTRKGASIRNLVTGQEMEIAPSGDPRSVPKIQIPDANDLNSQVRLSEKRKSIVKSIKKALPIVEPSLPVAAEPEIVRPEPAVQPIGEKTQVDLPEVAPPSIAPPSISPELPTPGPELVEVPPIPEPISEVKVTEALSIKEPALKINRILKVQEVYQRRGKRALVARTGLKTLKVPVALEWEGAKPDDKVFVQVSKDKNFSKPWTERETLGRNVVIQDWKPGRNFWRISRDRQAWSESGEVVVKPGVAIAQNPSVVAFKKNVVVYGKGRGPEAQAKLRFQDSGLTKARGWVLQGSNTAKFEASKTRTVYVSEPRIDIPLAKPGKYFFRVRSVASAGEISSFSNPLQVNAVKAVAPPVQIQQSFAKAKVNEGRELAAIDAEKSTIDDELKEDEFTKPAPVQRQSTRLNTVVENEPPVRFRPWSVTLEGGETALVSSDQLATSVDPASVHVIGLKGGYNDGRNAVMAAYHSKFGASNGQGTAQGNSRIDSRYTRWWQTQWNWLRLGWAGGLSSYNNSSSTTFSKGYTAAKTGLGVDMNVGRKWKTGGDVLVGTWTDANKLYEFGGFVSYDFTTELAFGVGYRVSLFEAAVDSATPLGLPYREAMGEAYSSLKFAF